MHRSNELVRPLMAMAGRPAADIVAMLESVLVLRSATPEVPAIPAS